METAAGRRSSYNYERKHQAKCGGALSWGLRFYARRSLERQDARADPVRADDVNIAAALAGRCRQSSPRSAALANRIRYRDPFGALKSLNDSGIGHTAAFAHRLKTQALSIDGERAQQCGR